MSAGRPTRAQGRAHRTQIARRLGLRRSLVRVATGCVVGLGSVVVRVRGAVRLAEASPRGPDYAAAALARLRALSWPSGVEARRVERAFRRTWDGGEPDERRRGRARSKH